MDAVQHSDSCEVVRCQPTECRKNYKRVTAMHEAEELSTSSANEHGPETKGIRVKIPGVNIPEFAESIISVEVLAERVEQSSLGVEDQAIKYWGRGPRNQVLAERVKQSSLGGEGQVINS